MNDAPSPSPTAGLARFVVRVVLFLVPLAVGGMLLLAAPLDRTFAWHFVRGDCWERGVELDDRMRGGGPPIDVAFLGTSRTIHGIDEAAIQQELDNRGVGRHIANFGYCRNGRNMQTALARDLLATQPVRHLVVEVENREFPEGHAMFGYVAATEDLWARPGDRGWAYVTDAYHGFLVRLDEAKARFLGLPLPTASAPKPKPRIRGIDRVAPPEELGRTKAKRQARAAQRERPSAQRNRLGYAELHRLKGLAEATGTKLHFLYLTSYGEPWARVWSRDLYESMGDVWIPPRGIFEDPANWFDRNHVNMDGARLLADWLAKRIAEIDEDSVR